MAISGKKKLRRAVIVIICLVIAGFLLNWFLTYRLEKYLKSELGNIISNETDGFYNLRFADLQIDFFSGELLMEGVTLIPDSVVFSKLEKQDSLPHVYLDLSLGSIHFKGVNLTWRFDYTKLHFDLFEIRNTNVNIYELDKVPNNRPDSTDKREGLGNIYELISPYITVLTAKEMNLSDASFTYNIKDVQNPATYSLTDINFRVHGFILDENSSTSGKLLYSDNFEFTAKNPQVLLVNKQFELNTKNILLSTRDSIILVEGIRLRPQEALIADSLHIVESYANALVKKVEVNGIHFKREDAQNYLDARSLNIISSKIEYYNAQNIHDDTTNVKVNISDSLLTSWSLYGLISPLLKEVVVGQILIDSAQFKYTDDSKGKRDIYSMDKFQFIANGFRVDSVVDTQDRLLYSDNFIINAAGIKGIVRSKNQKANIGYLYLDMSAGDFKLGEMKLEPLSRSARNDYLSGTVKQLEIMGMKYKNAIEVEQLFINNPRIEYTSSLYDSKNNSKKISNNDPQDEIFSSLLQYFHIRNINLKDAYVTYNDRQNNNVYKVSKLNFRVSNFFMNGEQHSLYDLFDFSEFDISFEDFDNYLPDKQHRLQINKASLSSKGGMFSLRGLRIIPEKQNKTIPAYYDVSIPNLRIEGLSYKKHQNDYIFNTQLFDADSIQAKIERLSDNKKKSSEKKDQLFDVPIEHIGQININNVDFQYIDYSKKDSTNINLRYLSLKDVTNSDNKGLNLDQLLLSGVNLHLHQPSGYVNLLSDSLFIGGLNWKIGDKFRLERFDVKRPVVRINQQSIQKQKEESDTKDIYDAIGRVAKLIELRQVNIADAELDYKQSKDSLTKTEKLNHINLALYGFSVNTERKSFAFDDIEFNTSDLSFPIDKGFYTLQIGELGFEKGGVFKVNDIKLIPAYPKMEFAYHHPQHKDWFDVAVGNIELRGIDYPTFFRNKKLNLRRANINNVEFQNFKNHKIEVGHNLMPMIYEGLQKLPLKVNIDTVDVRNFNVVYEELTKKGTIPGKIFFTDMNGLLTGFTNEVTFPQQYINLDANGKLMGTGYFTANWKLPVDSTNDNFLLSAHLIDFNLEELNQIITPMFPARVKSGFISDFKFNTSATSLGADVDMNMLYNDLTVQLLKEKDGKLVESKFTTWAANTIVRNNNPNNPNKKSRQPSVTIVRDPYHSTFNYIWQILKPPLIESVGVSKGKQDFMGGVSRFFGKVKSFFGAGKKKEEKKETH